ncbi:MAG: hypothetical protein ACEQSF_06490, partial [Solirubrobacteraceae bacterium]
ELEKNLDKLVFSYNLLKKENKDLVESVNILNKHISILTTKVKDLNEGNTNLKIVNALHGNTENSKLLKARINKLVSEVDLCIKQLTGL